MKIPTISAKSLWHWGDLNREKKNQNGMSWEGHLFSMSACPLAWEQIAKLGGSKLHVRAEPSVLLDMHTVLFEKTRNAKLIRNHVEAWAIENSLLEPRTVFQVREYDCEADDYRISEYFTQEEADREVELMGEATIIPTTKLIGTEALHLTHSIPVKFKIGLEYALIDWAKEKLGHRLQGVYWDEPLDPFGNSAPRAGMFDCLSLGLKLESGLPDDEEALLGISSVKWINEKGLDAKDDEPMP